jgi:hypothetical protein
MNEKKLSELLKNADFMKQILEAKTGDEVKNAFVNEGIILNEQELAAVAQAIILILENGGKLPVIQNDNTVELENVSGGCVGVYNHLQICGQKSIKIPPLVVGVLKKFFTIFGYTVLFAGGTLLADAALDHKPSQMIGKGLNSLSRGAGYFGKRMDPSASNTEDNYTHTSTSSSSEQT